MISWRNYVAECFPRPDSDMYSGGESPSGTLFFSLYLPKRNRTVMYQPASKHRRCGNTALVRTIPENFKGLGLSQQIAFDSTKAMLTGI